MVEEPFNQGSRGTREEDLDRYLTSSMKVLSLEDLTLALEEVHGAARAEQEGIVLVKQNLRRWNLN